MAAAKPAAQTALDALTKEGAFNRKESGYRNQVEPGGRFPPEGAIDSVYALGCNPLSRGILCDLVVLMLLICGTAPLHTLAAAIPARGSRDHLPPAGRYHLYISYACPWAARCLATLYLKGVSPHVCSPDPARCFLAQARAPEPSYTELRKAEALMMWAIS